MGSSHEWAATLPSPPPVCRHSGHISSLKISRHYVKWPAIKALDIAVAVLYTCLFVSFSVSSLFFLSAIFSFTQSVSLLVFFFQSIIHSFNKTLIYLSLHLSRHQITHPYVCIFFYLSIYLAVSVYISIYLSVHLLPLHHIYTSICLLIYHSVGQFITLSVCIPP